MARKPRGQDERVLAVLRPALTNLLELGVKYRLHKRIIEEKQRDWRELEAELSYDKHHPVQGFGIIATRDVIEIHEEEGIGADELSPLANQIPFDAALACYAFTILEACGDEVVEIVNPSFARERTAWHRRIPADLQKLPVDPIEASELFAEPFGLPPHRGYVPAIKILAELKRARNEFAHRGEGYVVFEDFHRGVLIVATHVYFANLHSEKQLKLYPFTIYDEQKWR
jgi:hypothetical protein